MIKSPDTVLANQDRPPLAGKVLQRLQEKSRWRWTNLLLGILASAVFLYLALRGIDLPQVLREVQSANYALLALAICVGMVSNLFRAARWRLMLGGQPRVRLRPVFTSMMIGYLANNVLPARMGELVRIYVLERKAGVSKSTSAATVVLERLTDVLVLVALIMLIAFFLPLPAMVRSGSWIAATVSGALIILLLFLTLRDKGLARVATRMAGSLSYGVGQKALAILERFVDGLSVLRSGKQALFTLMLTFVIWSIEAASVGLVMKSLDLNLPWIAALLLVVVLSLSYVIPAAPGAVGTYEFFAITALIPFAVKNDQAVGLALVLHAVVYVTATALGLVCLWAESLSLRELMIKAPDRQEEKA
ncbi:MAG TPA: lysylphosphatidylglycerol synthase transmembrane domain-containing protein [Nitrospiraceae bacterium]|nr:lysylphosphatidylglycerol synthase transmembrane domain-containing protein [Nitrospiraceae bacterium]